MTDEQFFDDIEEQPTFEDALRELTSEDESIPGPTVLYGLSGLSETDIERFKEVWRKLDETYRLILMQMLVDVSESNFELDYQAIGWEMLSDATPEIRQVAIEVMWENDSIKLMNRLIKMLESDTSNIVRAEAAKALGRFVLLGELGDLPEHETIRAQSALITILKQADQAVEIRGNALESIANCSHDEIKDFINSAYNDRDDRLQMSAITAMGRTCDYDTWGRFVLKEIENKSEDIQIEAVRAAGELQAEDAVPNIIALLDSDNEELVETAIWALGEIGGKQASRALDTFANHTEDKDLLALIDEALAAASLTSGDLMMLDFGMDDGDMIQ